VDANHAVLTIVAQRIALVIVVLLFVVIIKIAEVLIQQLQHMIALLMKTIDGAVMDINTDKCKLYLTAPQLLKIIQLK